MGVARRLSIAGYLFEESEVRSIARHNVEIASQPGCRKEPRLGAIFLSLPRRCNLRCPYCYTDARNTPRPSGLSAAEVEGVIAAASELRAGSIVVAGEGEPFLSPLIWTIIKNVARHRMWCVIFTNGTLLSRQTADRLYASPVSVILKLNSFRPDMQDRLVGVPGAHTGIYRGLKTLMAAGFRAPRLALQSAIMKPILADLKDVFVFCRRHNIIPYIETYVALGRGARPHVRRALEPDRETVRQFFAEMARIDREEFGISWPEASRARVVAYGSCNKNRLAVTVTSNGDVFRCVTESQRLGNIRESDLRDILRSPKTLRALVEEACMGCASVCLSCPEESPSKVRSRPC